MTIINLQQFNSTPVPAGTTPLAVTMPVWLGRGYFGIGFVF